MTRTDEMTRMRTLLSTAAIAAAIALGLGGCATEPPLSDGLHASVVRIADRASVEDFTGATAELLLLERQVDAAVAAGELDAQTEADIRASIELVRADLDAAAMPTPTPTPTPTDADDNSGPGNSDGKGNDDKGKDDKGKDD